MKTIDLTPTWAGLMPAFIAVLQDGAPEGQEAIRGELMRLAGIVDSANEAARAAATPATEEAATEERNAFGLASVALGRERAATDLARRAADLAAHFQHARAGAFYEAAAQVAPAGMSDRAAWVAASDSEYAKARARRSAVELAAECLPQAAPKKGDSNV